MGYVFLAFSDPGREFALDVRSRLEAARISTWLRQPDLASQPDKDIIHTALLAASAVLVVWIKPPVDGLQAVQMQRELREARQFDIPILMLTAEVDFDGVLAKLKAIPALKTGGVPLPMPISPDDLPPPLPEMRLPRFDRQRLWRWLIILIIIIDIGLLTTVGIITIAQMPAAEMTPAVVTQVTGLASSESLPILPTRLSDDSRLDTSGENKSE
jgi:hypothetical protein